jgi:signal transducer and activator of transcription 5B
MVNVSIISEAQALMIQNTPNESTVKYQSGEIVNCVGNLEFNPASNHLCADFKNMQLKKVKRGGTDDKIVDEKFALFFQAKINVGDMVFAVWAMSLPVVVISHAKQQIDALATVIWDNAFSELYRKPFEEPEKVKWSRLSEVLSIKFAASTGRELTPNNLHFICEKLVRQPLEYPISGDLEISRAQFCKDFIGVDFTFWTWFFRALELTHDHLKELWSDGLIAGFINKANTEYYLYNCPPGTFLLRFSESVLGELS